MQAKIHHNGSRKDASIEDLIEIIYQEPLDPKFGDCAQSVPLGPPRFIGNFSHLSHGFDIETDDDIAIIALIKAIKWNRSRWNCERTVEKPHKAPTRITCSCGWASDK